MRATRPVFGVTLYGLAMLAVAWPSLGWTQILPGNLLNGLPKIRDVESRRASSCDPDLKQGNRDYYVLNAGQTTVVADLKGPGIITHFWTTVGFYDRNYPRLIVARMYWDGEEQPSVEVPLGDFFGVGHALEAPLVSLPVTVTSDGRARNCWWPMPFRKSARITLTNEGSEDMTGVYAQVDWIQVKRLPRDTGYFHAQYRQARPTEPGKNYVIADIAGRGHYVGTVLSARQLSEGWWGEGDDFWYIDGSTEPVIRGTGAEDYFCDAWGLRRQDTPFYGASVVEPARKFARTTAYRWHIPDPVTFRKSLRLEIECAGFGLDENGQPNGFRPRSDEYASVAFWYQVEPHKPFPPLPSARDRLVYNSRRMIEAEKLRDATRVSAGTLSTAEAWWLNKGSEVVWSGAEPDASMTVTFETSTADAAHLVLLLTEGPDRGQFRIELDGVSLEPVVDLYATTWRPRDFYADLPDPRPGTHTLRFTSVGRHPRGAGDTLGFDAVQFVPAHRANE